MQTFFRPVRDLAQKYNILQSAMASAERIFHLLDNQEALPPAQVAPAPSTAETEAGARPTEVRFVGVTFGYDPARPVVRGVDFTLPPRDGPRRWSAPPARARPAWSVCSCASMTRRRRARCSWTARPARDGRAGHRSAGVALVSQEVQLLTGTMRENIALGRPDATPERLERALAVSGAAHFVNGLEQGLDTPPGRGRAQALRRSAPAPFPGPRPGRRPRRAGTWTRPPATWTPRASGSDPGSPAPGHGRAYRPGGSPPPNHGARGRQHPGHAGQPRGGAGQARGTYAPREGLYARLVHLQQIKQKKG